MAIARELVGIMLPLAQQLSAKEQLDNFPPAKRAALRFVWNSFKAMVDALLTDIDQPTADRPFSLDEGATAERIIQGWRDSPGLADLLANGHNYLAHILRALEPDPLTDVPQDRPAEEWRTISEALLAKIAAARARLGELP